MFLQLMKQLFSGFNLSIKMLRFHLLISDQIWLVTSLSIDHKQRLICMQNTAIYFFRLDLFFYWFSHPFHKRMFCNTCKSTGKDNVWTRGTTNFRKDALVLHESSRQHENAVHATSLRKKTPTQADFWEPVCV